MNKNRHKIVKSIGALVLAMVIALAMGGLAPQQAYAAGGNITVKLANTEGLDGDVSFDFEVFKVGHFSGPGIVLEDNLKDSEVDVDFPSDSTEDEAAKAERMVESASALAKYIDDNGISLEAVGSFSLTPGNEHVIPVTENGLYLVRGNTVKIDTDGSNCNWTPQPVYVAILNGDSSITISNDVVIKIVRTPIPFDHRVRKSWIIPEGSGDVKPDAIYVNIRYGGEIIDTIRLTSGCSWTYDWVSEEDGDEYKYIGHDINGNKTEKTFTPNKDKPYWSVDEILDSSKVTGWNLTDAEKAEIDELAENFSVKYGGPTIVTTGADGETTEIEEHEVTNTYEPPEVPPEEPPEPPDNPPKRVKTGDYAHLMGWAAVLLAGCAALVVVVYRRKKNR